MKKSISLTHRLAVILPFLCGFLVVAASAQTTYEADAVDTLGGNNLLWEDTATIWDTPFGTPAANAPGSNLTGGAATDSVILGNHRNGTQGQNYRIQNLDIGEVENLTLGSANSTHGTQQVQLQVRANNGHVQVNGTTTLGAVTGVGTNQAGQISMNQNNTTAFVDLRGPVTAGSDHDGNALVLNANGSTINVAGDITAGAGQGMDLRLVRGEFRMDTTGDGNTDTGLQTFNIDNLDIGDNALAGNSANFSFGVGKTLNIGDDIRVGRNIATTAISNDATLNIFGATVVAVDDLRIGELNNNDDGGATVTGTVNVGNVAGSGEGGTLTVDQLNMGVQIAAGTGSASIGDAKGTLNVEDDATVNARVLVLGLNAGGQGTVNVNKGTLNVAQQINIAGDGNNGIDDGTSGTLNVRAGGTLNAALAATAQKNLEVGRDGDGVLNVDGGTINLGRGNFIVGQASSGGNANNSRGTVTFQNGATVNVGDVYSGAGSNVDGFSSGFNIQRGGGDVTHTGAGTTVRIEFDLNMQNASTTAGIESTNPNSSYSIDNGLLEVGRDFNPRNNQAGVNTLTITGADSVVEVGRNFNGSQSSFTLAFDFEGGSAITDIDIVGNGNVNGATLSLLNTTGLAVYSGDILLLDVGAAQNGSFAGLPEGTKISGTAYEITYEAAGTTGMNSIGLVAAIPEPGSLVLFTVAGTLLFAFRRRLR